MLASKRYKDDLEKQKAERRNMENSSNVKQWLTNLKQSNLGNKKRSKLLNLVSAIFIFFFHQKIALQKLRKMLFISSKKLFSFSRYSNFCVFVLLFLPVGHGFRGWSKINLKVYDAISCLNKNSVTHFVRYLKKEKKV